MEPKAHSSKKRSAKHLEQVMAMSECDPRRMDEIRKYAAIYGRFDCKRRPEKPLTLHEVCVNEAAAQICKFIPALLNRRDILFPYARQVVKDSGFGHSTGIARFSMRYGVNIQFNWNYIFLTKTNHIFRSQGLGKNSNELETSQSKRMRLGSDTSSDFSKVATSVTSSCSNSCSDLFSGDTIINLD